MLFSLFRVSKRYTCFYLISFRSAVTADHSLKNTKGRIRISDMKMMMMPHKPLSFSRLQFFIYQRSSASNQFSLSLIKHQLEPQQTDTGLSLSDGRDMQVSSLVLLFDALRISHLFSQDVLKLRQWWFIQAVDLLNCRFWQNCMILFFILLNFNLLKFP